MLPVYGFDSAEIADGILLVLKIPIDGAEGHRCVKYCIVFYGKTDMNFKFFLKLRLLKGKQHFT